MSSPLLERILRSKHRADGSYPLDAMERATKEFNIWFARRKGETFVAIATNYGLSAQRVRIIANQVDRMYSKLVLENKPC